jgi:hypothetical protein
MTTKKNSTSPFVYGLSGASVLLMTALLTGCNEPKAPAAGETPSAGPAAASTAVTPAAVAVDPTLLVELSINQGRAVAAPAKNCNIESVGGNKFTAGTVDVQKGAPAVQINGWVADVDQHAVPATAYLQLDSADKAHRWRLPITTGVKRKDVVKNLGDDQAYLGAGYSAMANVGALPVGSYHTFIVFGDVGAVKACDNGRTIAVKE